MEVIMEKTNTLEENFEKLEGIVSDMSKDDVSLEKSFELYNQGLKLIQECNSQIGDIEKKIIVLNEEENE